MNLTVLGCGRWGTFLAGYHCARNDVMLWGRPGSRSMMTLQTERKNEYMILPDKLRLETDLGRALNFAEMVIISISAQQLRSLAAQLQTYPLAGKTFILCMKGIEAESGKRLDPGVPGRSHPAG